MLQNLPYFSNSKSGQMGKIDLDEMKNEKSTSGLSGFLYLFQKCGKFLYVFLGHFRKHKQIISEE